MMITFVKHCRNKSTKKYKKSTTLSIRGCVSWVMNVPKIYCFSNVKTLGRTTSKFLHTKLLFGRAISICGFCSFQLFPSLNEIPKFESWDSASDSKIIRVYHFVVLLFAQNEFSVRQCPDVQVERFPLIIQGQTIRRTFATVGWFPDHKHSVFHI